jgi:hypothetical protein
MAGSGISPAPGHGFRVALHIGVHAEAIPA